MDTERLSSLVQQLYKTVAELEAMFPGRPFTPDGHLVGSIGECLAAHMYDLQLLPPSTPGKDAVAPDGRFVEIKATQGSQVAFRSEPEHVIVLKLTRDGRGEEVYNGPGRLVWKQFAGKTMPKNGQRQISLTRLAGLMEQVQEGASTPLAKRMPA